MKPEDLFEEAVAAVRDERIDPETARAAVARVGRRLAAGSTEAGSTAAPELGDEHRIRGCEGFRALLPAWRAGALTQAKRMLLEDHLRECVPCRRASRAVAREADRSAPRAGARWRPPLALVAGLAAAVVAGAALWLAFTGAPAPEARVRSVDGELVALEAGTARPVAAGEMFGAGRALRTAGGSRAVLELGDGSRVELAPRSEVTLASRRDGVVLELGRGQLIVEAAPQTRGHLYVRTDDCLVSVVGTIFSVNRGARGSRVSVLEGEVRVRQGAELAVLRPGDQLATSERLDRVPLEREIAWSRNAPAYRERLAALAALGRELDRVLAAPDLRSSTRLLDLAPADTAVWVAVPNLSGELAEAWATVERRAAENPALAGWWRERFGDGGKADEISAALEELRAVGGRLGPEVAIALEAGRQHGPEAPVVLAEVVDARGFEALLDREIARLNETPGGPAVRRVADPSAPVAPAEHELLIWLAPDGLLAASPSAARLAEVERALAAGGRGGFAGTPLHGRLAELYAGGVEWLVAVDAHALLDASVTEPTRDADLDALGIGDVDLLVVESRADDEGAVHRARLSFRGPRRGLASWLAEPAPSGAVEFVSGNAALAVAGVAKSPVAMFDDLIGLATRAHDGDVDHLSELESKLGISLRDDLAAALGGDFAFAIDGPWLPKPSWKVVVEVLDPARFEDALGRLIEAANREREERGRPPLVWSQEEAGGRLYRRLAAADGGVVFEATVADGYLVAAPSRALLVETLARRAAGDTLLASAAFRERLPRDAEPNFSGLAWQNLGESAGDLARLIAGAAGAEAGAGSSVEALAAAGPALALAYGGTDELSLVATGARGPLGLSLESLLALGESLAASEDPAPDAGTDEAAPETPARPAA